MSEEKEESGFSAIKKAVIGAITTAVAAGGAWLTGLLGGGASEPAATPANTPAPAPVVVNVQQNQENTQKHQNNSAPMVIKERVIEKQAAPAATAPATKPAKDEEDPW